MNNLLYEQGNILSYQDFERIYTFKPTFLQFYGIKVALKKWLQSMGINTEREKQQQALLPFNINIFFKSNKGSKDMYNILNQGAIPVVIAAERKWEGILNNVVGDWKKIHNCVTKISKNTKLCWFQYRIIHRILGTNTLLLKMNRVQCNLCTFCKEEPESIEHLLWGCHIVADIWHHLNALIFETTHIDESCLFHYKKYYIYRSKMQDENLM